MVAIVFVGHGGCRTFIHTSVVTVLVVVRTHSALSHADSDDGVGVGTCRAGSNTSLGVVLCEVGWRTLSHTLSSGGVGVGDPVSSFGTVKNAA